MSEPTAEPRAGGTTPNYGIPYPGSGDPVAAGADNIKAVADAVDAKLMGLFVPSNVLIGTPGVRPWRIEAATWVVTTDGNGASSIQLHAATTVVTVLATPGDTPNNESVSTFDYHPNYCQILYRVAGNPVVGAVRVNVIAIID